MRALLGILLLILGQASSGSLRVTIVDRETQAPLGGVFVRAADSSAPSRAEFTVESGPDGIADFGSVPPGAYEVIAWSETHLATDGLHRRPVPWPPPPADSRVIIRSPGVAYVRVVAGESTSVGLALPRGGVISGRVRPSERERSGLKVTLTTASSARPVLGHRIQSDTGRSVTADDMGRFAFRGLPTGEYYVSVARTTTGRPLLNNIYHPGVVDFHEAIPVRVEGGGHARIEFDAPRSPVADISGRVVDSSGTPGELVSRRLDFATGDVISYVIVPLSRSGAFSLPSKSGIEGLRYTREVNGETVAAATLALHVGAESQNNLRLQAVLSARIRGRFVFAQPYQPQPHDLDPVVYLNPEGDDAWLREGFVSFQHGPREDEFHVSGIFGAHRVEARAPDGWIVEGVVLEDGRDVLDRTVQFEPGRTYDRVRVMLSPFSATISGRIQGVDDAGGGILRRVDPVQGRVVVFPVDEESWPIWRLTKVADAGPDGSFSVPGITPGRDYYVASCAWPCDGSQEYSRALIPGATRVFVDRPGVFTVTLTRK